MNIFRFVRRRFPVTAVTVLVLLLAGLAPLLFRPTRHFGGLVLMSLGIAVA